MGTKRRELRETIELVAGIRAAGCGRMRQDGASAGPLAESALSCAGARQFARCGGLPSLRIPRLACGQKSLLLAWGKAQLPLPAARAAAAAAAAAALRPPSLLSSWKSALTLTPFGSARSGCSGLLYARWPRSLALCVCVYGLAARRRHNARSGGGGDGGAAGERRKECDRTNFETILLCAMQVIAVSI